MQICRALDLVIICFFVRFSSSLIEFVCGRSDDDDVYSSHSNQCEMCAPSRHLITLIIEDHAALLRCINERSCHPSWNVLRQICFSIRLRSFNVNGGVLGTSDLWLLKYGWTMTLSVIRMVSSNVLRIVFSWAEKTFSIIGRERETPQNGLDLAELW